VRSNNTAVAIVLGLAFSAGAVLLALVAAPSTMTLTRTAPKAVTVTVETRLFNRYKIGGFRIDGAESVEVVHSAVPATGTGPDAPYGISVYFVTRDGRIDPGLRQKLFDGSVSAVQEFFSSDAATTTFSVNDPASRFGRFIVVHLAVIFMSLIGLSATWTGLTGLFRRARS
jgi:hypothetical protein